MFEAAIWVRYHGYGEIVIENLKKTNYGNKRNCHK